MRALVIGKGGRPGPPRRSLEVDRRSAAGRLLASALGSALAMVDTTVMNVGGLAVTRSLDMGLTGPAWLVNGYVLSFAALLLLGGALATRFGARSVYTVGLTVFTVSSLIAGLATTPAGCWPPACSKAPVRPCSCRVRSHC